MAYLNLWCPVFILAFNVFLQKLLKCEIIWIWLSWAQNANHRLAVNHGYKASTSSPPSHPKPFLWIDEAESIASRLKTQHLTDRKKNEPMNMVLANYWYKNLCSGYTWARKIERGTVYSLSARCVCHILETTSYLGSFGAFFFYSLWAELYCIKISGWPKSLLGLFHSILWKKPNEIFDQPSNSSSLPLLKSISFLLLLFFFLKSAEASYHGIRTWRALES